MRCEQNWDGQQCVRHAGHPDACDFACRTCGNAMGGDEDAVMAHKCPVRVPPLGPSALAHLCAILAGTSLVPLELRAEVLVLLAVNGLVTVMGDRDTSATIILTKRGIDMAERAQGLFSSGPEALAIVRPSKGDA